MSWVNVAKFGNSGTALAAAAKVAMKSGRSLLISEEIQIDTAVGDIEPMMWFVNAGALNLLSGGSVDLWSSFFAPDRQVFKPAGGTLRMRVGLADVNAAWWGARFDGISDDTLPIREAIRALASALPWKSGATYAPDARVVHDGVVYVCTATTAAEPPDMSSWSVLFLQAGGTCHLPAGVGRTTGTITVPPFVGLVGARAPATRIAYEGTDAAIVMGDSVSTSQQGTLMHAMHLSGLRVTLTGVDADGIRVIAATQTDIRNVYVEGPVSTHRGRGVVLDASNGSTFFVTLDGVHCNHTFIGFHQTTSGEINGTTINYLNCSAYNTWGSPVDGSIGILVDASQGQGAVWYGGNIEACDVGVSLGTSGSKDTGGGGSLMCFHGLRFEDNDKDVFIHQAAYGNRFAHCTGMHTVDDRARLADPGNQFVDNLRLDGVRSTYDSGDTEIWRPGRSYVIDDLVLWFDVATRIARVYRCTHAGASASAPGPQGEGGYVDGGVVWAYAATPPTGGKLATGVRQDYIMIRSWSAGTYYQVGDQVMAGAQVLRAVSAGLSTVQPSAPDALTEPSIAWEYVSTPIATRVDPLAGEMAPGVSVTLPNLVLHGARRLGPVSLSFNPQFRRKDLPGEQAYGVQALGVVTIEDTVTVSLLNLSGFTTLPVGGSGDVVQAMMFRVLCQAGA